MKEGKQTDNIFDRYDFFGTSVPNHTLEGTKFVGSSIGCFFSVLLTGIMVFYGYQRGKIFITRDKPLISTFTKRETELHYVDIHDEHNFHIAWGIRKAFGGDIFKDHDH